MWPPKLHMSRSLGAVVPGTTWYESSKESVFLERGDESTESVVPAAVVVAMGGAGVGSIDVFCDEREN